MAALHPEAHGQDGFAGRSQATGGKARHNRTYAQDG